MRLAARRSALGLLSLAAFAVSAQELPHFSFVPTAPLPGDTVSIHVLTPMTSCPLFSSNAERVGSVITIRYVEGCVCLPGPVFPLELTEEVGPLPAGRYVVQLERSQVEHDGTACVEPVMVGEGELVVSGEELLLHDGRFLARATWLAFDGSSGAGRAVALTEQSGTFWFFDPANVELLVKVLDACPVNGHFWVFVAAASNVEYEIEVLDRGDDAVEIWTAANPLGQFPALVADTTAFATCP